MSGVAAQNADTLIFRSRSARSLGIGFPALNYSMLSPLNHSGYSLCFRSTRFRELPEHLSQFQLNSELGILYNHANDSYITTLGFNCGWSRHWKKTDRPPPLHLLAGAGATAGVNVYLKDDNTNNPMAYFFNLSLSPGLLLRYRFGNEKASFCFGQRIDLPVLSVVSSSEYSSALPFGFIEDEASFFDAMRIVSFGSLFKCLLTTTLDVTPSLEHRRKWPVFRISYAFTGMNYSNGDFTIKSVDHKLFFGAIFHLFQ